MLVTYIAACLFLYLSHAIPSAAGIRGWLVGLMGASVYRALYSVLSLFAVVWFVWSYSTTDIAGWLYTPAAFVIWAALFLLPLAFFLMVARLGTPYGDLDKPAAVRGIYRITRFPGSWGVLIWALVHLAATGDLKRVIAFGTFALVAVTALVKNEYVIRQQQGAEARDFFQATSFLPFAATLFGRQKISLAETGWKIPLVSLLLFLMFLVLHPVLFGVDPLSLLP